ncbi:MAG: CHASE2 domain-containing protein [Verrucomicrobia bacterium]|nr:CHASE2 domain-containing protein [Verrucomicrobiota bacterium]
MALPLREFIDTLTILGMSRLRYELVAIPLIFILGLWFISCQLLNEDNAVGQKLVRGSYDLPYIVSLGALEDSEVVIVYLDFRTYNLLGLEPLERFPRHHYAHLLRLLNQAGVRAVAFDIVFSGESEADSDAEFASAIQEVGNVYLAGEISQSSQDVTRITRIHTSQIEQPYAPFLDSAQGWGLASLPIDHDLVIRRNLPFFREFNIPSLSGIVAQSELQTSVPDGPLWNYFYGPPYTLPHLSMGDFLENPEAYHEFFQDKIVLVGARPTTSGFGMIQDEFRSPFFNQGNAVELFHAGVEIHATQLLNIIRRDWLTRPAKNTEVILFFVSSFFIVSVLCLLRPWSAVLVSLWMLGVLMGISVVVFHGFQWWTAWGVVGAVQIPGGLVASMTNRSLEWYIERRRFLASQRIADQRIREQASLLDQARDAILVCTLEGYVTYFNRCAGDLYNWKSEDSKPDQCFSFLKTLVYPEHFNDIVKQAQSRGEWVGEILQFRADGNRISIDSRWTIFNPPAIGTTHILMINTDITQKKIMEEQLYRAQRMDTIGAIAGGVAHDLNNILSPILMGVQLLKRQSPQPHDLKLLDAIESSTRRGAQMIHQVLAFSKGRLAEKTSVDPRKILVELEQFLVSTFPESIKIRMIIPDDLWTIMADSTQVHQVLLNLSINSRDAMPDGGELLIAADNAEFSQNGEPIPPGLHSGRHVLIMVSDSGSGMDESVAKKVFEPFFTTKPVGKGTGLGLASVANIVKYHNGAIQLHTEPGNGTTFEIYFPATPASNEPVSPAPSSLTLDPASRYVLVVDEELAFRELIHGYLSEHGFVVATAGTGAEALSLLSSPGKRPDLAILNSSLPGFTNLDKELFHTGPLAAIPLVLLHDSNSPGFEDTLSDAEKIILQKPFTMDQLLLSISTILRKNSPSASL